MNVNFNELLECCRNVSLKENSPIDYDREAIRQARAKFRMKGSKVDRGGKTDSTADINIIGVLQDKWDQIGLDYIEAVSGASMESDSEKRAMKISRYMLKGNQVQKAVVDFIEEYDFKSKKDHERYKEDQDAYLEQAFPSDRNYST